jgi:hypothetical protein
MDKALKQTLASVNLSLTINKMLFRKKMEPKKAEGINVIIEDLLFIDEVFKELKDENKILIKKIYQLNLELMKANQRINDLRIYEND